MSDQQPMYSIYIPNESVLHDLADQITESIFLLDPTSVSGTFLLTLSSTPYDDVILAHSMLLCASKKTLNMMKGYTINHMDEVDGMGGDSIVNQIICDTVATCADLYRALILSSYLQLIRLMLDDKLCLKAQPSEPNKIDHLCLTIKRCIALLQSLSLIVRQSELYYLDSTIITNANDAFGIKGPEDWHDDLLPPPLHGLLQDCFLRKDRHTEDGYIFGKDDREISLDFKTYDTTDQLQSRILLCIDKMGTLTDEPIGNLTSYRYQVDESLEPMVNNANNDTFDEFLINTDLLEQEENILLEVAFPDATFGSFSRSNSKNAKLGVFNPKKKRRFDRSCYHINTHENVAKFVQKFGLGKFIWNQLMVRMLLLKGLYVYILGDVLP